MKFTLSTTERVNVGNYEFVEISAGIEFSEDEVPEGIGPPKFARDKLDALLLSHRRRAEALVPEDSSSFITDHPALER
ncbi:hypothetical protein ACIOHC_35880 [Streptomyces sp. NPDC088252]|uniref:hypothetical protein n=1 Tax=Streptomyces sp. NPDC088252 TaxID=3365845 RepID=UPI0038280A01